MTNPGIYLVWKLESALIKHKWTVITYETHKQFTGLEPWPTFFLSLGTIDYDDYL